MVFRQKRTGKPLRQRVVAVQPIARTHPKKTFRILRQGIDGIVANRSAVAGNVQKGFKRIPVEAVQAIVGGNPEKAFFIAQCGMDGIAGKPVGGGIVVEKELPENSSPAQWPDAQAVSGGRRRIRYCFSWQFVGL